jgi:hypothetical protein
LFSDEKTMVFRFIELLKQSTTPWGELQIGTEFFYQRGRTDLVAVSEEGNVIAFEAKLKQWKIALQQAYRNKCFADISYVLLPKEEVHNASRYFNEFKRRDVGLCYISEEEVNILFDAQCTEPLQPWLRHKALLYVNKEEETYGEEPGVGCKSNL